MYVDKEQVPRTITGTEAPPWSRSPRKTHRKARDWILTQPQNFEYVAGEFAARADTSGFAHQTKRDGTYLPVELFFTLS